MKTFSKKDPVVISCYGDSNTRYFYGDTQEDGPAQESYPVQLQELFQERSSTSPASRESKPQPE